jgi:hypothetical protein
MRSFAVLAFACSAFIGSQFIVSPSSTQPANATPSNVGVFNTSTDAQASWSEFAVPDSDFAVSLPSAPRARAAVGTNTTRFTRAYDAVYDGMAFSVSYEFWPSDTIQKKLPANELLTLSRDRILQTTSNLRKEKRFPVGDGAAVDFTVDSPAKTQSGPYSLRVRFITRTDEAANVHAYVLVATFKSSDEQDPDIERFLTSFRVLPEEH